MSGNHSSQFKIFLSGLLIFLWSSVAFTQSVGKIAGSVVESETGNPLPGANVVIVGTMLGAASDVKGEYYILNVPPGKYQVSATMMGFEKMVVVDTPPILVVLVSGVMSSILRISKPIESIAWTIGFVSPQI